jgi:hypothetical protein
MPGNTHACPEQLLAGFRTTLRDNHFVLAAEKSLNQ